MGRGMVTILGALIVALAYAWAQRHPGQLQRRPAGVRDQIIRRIDLEPMPIREAVKRIGAIAGVRIECTNDPIFDSESKEIHLSNMPLAAVLRDATDYESVVDWSEPIVLVSPWEPEAERCYVHALYDVRDLLDRRWFMPHAETSGKPNKPVAATVGGGSLFSNSGGTSGLFGSNGLFGNRHPFQFNWDGGMSLREESGRDLDNMIGQLDDMPIYENSVNYGDLGEVDGRIQLRTTPTIHDKIEDLLYMLRELSCDER